MFRYGQSIFCLPLWPKFSDIFDLCLHWVSVVRDQPYFPSMCMVCRKPEFAISLSSEEKYHKFNFSSNVPAKDFAKPPYVLTVSKVSRSWNKNCRKRLLPKNKQTNLFFYPDDLEILKTWISFSTFKYFQVVRIEKQIDLFVYLEKVWPNNFVSRSTDLK